MCSCDCVVGSPTDTRTSTLGACVWLVVGLGVDRIVDASLLLSPPPGVGGCCLCRPISTSQLEAVTGLPLLAYQPSSLLGAYQEGRVLLVETLS